MCTAKFQSKDFSVQQLIVGTSLKLMTKQIPAPPVVHQICEEQGSWAQTPAHKLGCQ